MPAFFPAHDFPRPRARVDDIEMPAAAVRTDESLRFVNRFGGGGHRRPLCKVERRTRSRFTGAIEPPAPANTALPGRDPNTNKKRAMSRATFCVSAIGSDGCYFPSLFRWGGSAKGTPLKKDREVNTKSIARYRAAVNCWGFFPSAIQLQPID